MAAGTPIITTNLAALSTTVGDAGILLNGSSYDQNYHNRFIAECISMLQDKEKWRSYSFKGLDKASQYTWDTIADEWLKLL